MKISIQQPEFFPWLGFFDKVLNVDQIIFLDNVQFKKRYFENRNRICTVNDWCWIRTPVKVKGRFKQLINEVEIDNAQTWQKTLVNSIRSSYSKAPNWHSAGGEELCDLINSKTYSLLLDFNVAIINFLFKKFNIEKSVMFASDLGLTTTGSELIFDICMKTGATDYLSGKDGVNYLDEEVFNKEKINIQYQCFNHPEYTQHNTIEFIEGMSAIDLLFNGGSDSISLLYT